MTRPRYSHTATLLQDGRVLIAGGQDNSTGPLSTTEIYDPATQTFAPGPTMTVGRSGHTATLLPDGRVLMVGGDSELGIASGTNEVYDPSNRTFTAIASLSSAQSERTATLLASGKVLIAGGVSAENQAGLVVASPELYDPSTAKFTVAGAYAGSLAGPVLNLFSFTPTSTLLSDGTVLFATMPAAQVYDPVSGAFSLRGAMSVKSQLFGTIVQLDYIGDQSATLLLNGEVLVAGGEQEDFGRFASAQLYDPASGVFLFTGDMTVARDLHAATLFPDGTVLMTGGGTQTCSTDLDGCWFSGSTASADLYDPVKGAFAAAGDMTASRELHTATLLNSGDVLIAGGVAYADGVSLGLASAELYHPASLSLAPVLLSISGDGKGQGAIWRATTGQLISPQSPGSAGDVLSMYVSGLAPGGLIPPQVSVGGQAAEIDFFGNAPGYPGYSQVNFRMPGGVAAGSATAVRLTYLGRSSNSVLLVAR